MIMQRVFVTYIDEPWDLRESLVIEVQYGQLFAHMHSDTATCPEVAAEQEMAAEQASKGGSLPAHRKSVQSFASPPMSNPLLSRYYILDQSSDAVPFPSCLFIFPVLDLIDPNIPNQGRLDGNCLTSSEPPFSTAASHTSHYGLPSDLRRRPASSVSHWNAQVSSKWVCLKIVYP